MKIRFAAFSFITILFLAVTACNANGPTLTSVVPSVIALNSPSTVLTLNGSNFQNQDFALWNQSAKLATTYISKSTMRAVLPASALTIAGQGTVSVVQATGNQSASQPLSITIGNVAPTLSSIAPDKTLTNAASLSITVTGTNFNTSSVVMWGSTSLATTFVNSTSLTAVVPPASYAAAGTTQVTVSNPGSGGGSSGASTFTAVAPLQITTTTLPAGTVNTPYSATVNTSGGLAPVTCSITGTLPPGLSANGCSISGTPTATGTFSITATATDSYGSLAVKALP